MNKKEWIAGSNTNVA